MEKTETIIWHPYPETKPPKPGNYFAFSPAKGGKEGTVYDWFIWDERGWTFFDNINNKDRPVPVLITHWAPLLKGPEL